MKFGIRKPNIKNSVKARTTGRAKRMVKKATNPFYGKKGMGFINNPKKAVYNKVYHKTSISAFDAFKKSSNLLYNIFIAFPLFCVLGIYQLLFYCYKYIFIGFINIIKKLISLFKKNKKEAKH